MILHRSFQTEQINSATGTGSDSFGYIGGGYGYNSPDGNRSKVERLDYNNDTANTVVKGSLTVARHYLQATGNNSFGYYAGGYNGSANISTIDRLDYSNDTAAAVAKGPMTIIRQQFGAMGNQSFGYFGGGWVIVQ